MSDNQSQPTPDTPTSKQLRDTRRQAHEAQKTSTAGKGGGMKGKMGKGQRKP